MTYRGQGRSRRDRAGLCCAQWAGPMGFGMKIKLGGVECGLRYFLFCAARKRSALVSPHLMTV